jgi:ABC-2 type transport system permease protein
VTVFTTLLRIRMRRDRWQLLSWVLAFGLVMLFTASAMHSTYGAESAREAVMRFSLTNPALLVVRGVPQGTSIGALFTFQIMAFTGLLIGVMSTFLVVRHTRADEEIGRAELVAATRAGRTLPTIATAVWGVMVNAVIAVVVFLACAAGSLPADGSLVFALAIGATGIAFLGVGFVCAQVFSTSRAANGWAAALVGLAYVVRGIGDATGTRSGEFTLRSGWASWLSPIGWAQQTRPFEENIWWPMILGPVFGIVLFLATLALQSVRDNGEGLVAARPGRRSASAALHGPLGLAWRLQRASVVGWAVGALAIALLAGSLGPDALDAVVKDPQVGNAVRSLVPGGNGSLMSVFIVAMMGIVGLIVAGCAMQCVMRLRQEEALGTAEVVLATRVGRLRWFAGYLVVGVTASVVILLACGALTGAMLSASDPALFGDSVGAALVQLPAVLAYLAVLGLVFALLPRATIGVGWAFLALGAVFGEFGGLMKLPDWLRNLSPSTHTPAIPLPDADWSGAWWMTAVAILAAALASAAIRRRDVAVG